MGGRGLSDGFLKDLKRGFLKPILNRATLDDTLDLEIRENYINIYYRGGNLLMLQERAGRPYFAYFEKGYAKGDFAAAMTLLPQDIATSTDVCLWLEAIPKLKLAMDLHFGRKPSEEREYQQQVVRDNNYGGIAGSTDYFVCDIEYAIGESRSEMARFDLVLVHWPAKGATRKQTGGRRLVLAEMKHGIDALQGATPQSGQIHGKSGLAQHIVDADTFMANPNNVLAIKDEMINVFNQKRSLGLIDCGHDLEAFSDEPPILLVILANYHPRSKILTNVFGKQFPTPANVELQFATSCFTGYGLFDPAIHTLAQFKKSFAGYIHTP